MKKTKQSFTDYYADLSMDYIGLLCAIGNYYDLEVKFTWSHDKGFDVIAENRSVKSSDVNLWKTQLQQAKQNLGVWNDFVEDAEGKAYELFGRRADELISAKLCAAYIYMNAAEKLKKQEIKELSFIGVMHRNNELHYLFKAGEKEVDVHFKGAVMDKFLARIENEAKQSGENKLYVTKN